MFRRLMRSKLRTMAVVHAHRDCDPGDSIGASRQQSLRRSRPLSPRQTIPAQDKGRDPDAHTVQGRVCRHIAGPSPSLSTTPIRAAPRSTSSYVWYPATSAGVPSRRNRRTRRGRSRLPIGPVGEAVPDHVRPPSRSLEHARDRPAGNRACRRTSTARSCRTSPVRRADRSSTPWLPRAPRPQPPLEEPQRHVRPRL